MPRPRLDPANEPATVQVKLPAAEKAEWLADATAATPPGGIVNLSAWLRAVVNESRAWRRNFRVAPPALPAEAVCAVEPGGWPDGSWSDLATRNSFGGLSVTETPAPIEPGERRDDRRAGETA